MRVLRKYKCIINTNLKMYVYIFVKVYIILFKLTHCIKLSLFFYMRMNNINKILSD